MTRRARTFGFTTVELLVALAVTSLISLGIASMMTMVAQGTQEDRGARSTLLRAHAAQVRLRSFISPALNVFAYDHYRGIALWLLDDVPEDNIHITEVRVIWWNAVDGEFVLERVEFPDSWSDEQLQEENIVLAPTDDPFDAMETKRAEGHTVQERLVEGLAEFSVAFDGATPAESDTLWVTCIFEDAYNGQHEVLLSYTLPNYVALGGE